MLLYPGPDPLEELMVSKCSKVAGSRAATRYVWGIPLRPRLSLSLTAWWPVLRYAVFAALFVGGCAVPLDDAPSPGDPGSPATPTESCSLFADPEPPVVALAGPGRSVPIEDGRYLWFFDAATPTSGDIALSTGGAVDAGLTAAEGCGATRVFEGSDAPETLFAPSPLGDTYWLLPQDGVRIQGETWVYYAALRSDPDSDIGLSVAGYGVARWDAELGKLVPTDQLLWTSDRPSYGTSAMLDGDDVVVYGCRGGDGFLVNDCFVARVPADQIANETAYTYYKGGAEWVPRPDEAALVVAAGGVHVRFHEGLGRYLMLDIPVFGDRVEARTAISPQGPWSEPVVIARCALPEDDEEAHCGGVFQHPELLADPSSERVVFTYAISTFAEGDPRAANPEAYWPQLVEIDLPELP